MPISYSVVYLVPATMLGTQYQLNEYLLIECFGESIGRKQCYLIDHQDRKKREVSLATIRNDKAKEQAHICHSLEPNRLLPLFFLPT